MRLLLSLILSIASNIAAFLVAERFLSGFSVSHEPAALIGAAVIFGLLNLSVKPILKFALGPLILLTLGLGFIIINALILYLLTLFTAAVSIEGTITLFYAALLISVVGVIVTLVRKAVIRI